MIVSRFLLWARTASPPDRAEAVGALARAFLYSDLSPDDRWQAETALTAMLDDRSSRVRVALAEALAVSPRAPRHLIVALAGDTQEVAGTVLRRSPVLADADLVDCAALGDERIQCAIASRPVVSASVSAALAEIGEAAALATLAANPGATIADFSLARMVERHGPSAEVREALLRRPDLPVDITQAIAAALADTLKLFVTGRGWLSPERSDRVAREARERTTVTLSSTSRDEDAARLAAHLRRTGQLTPALLLRAILSGADAFAQAAFCELTAMEPKRVGAILRSARGTAFGALFGRAGLPASLLPAFEAARLASRQDASSADGRLSRGRIKRALLACADLPFDEAGRLVALLRRFEVEAARDEARRDAEDLAERAANELGREPSSGSLAA